MKINKALTVFLKDKCVNSKRQEIEQLQPEPTVGDGVMVFDMSKTNAHFRIEKIEQVPEGKSLELLRINTLAAYAIEHIQEKECYVITLEEGSGDEYVLLDPYSP